MKKIKLVNNNRNEYNYTKSKNEIEQENNNNFKIIEEAINYILDKIEGTAEK